MDKTIDVLVFKAKQFETAEQFSSNKESIFEYKEIKDDLNEFYNIINCDTIDIVKRQIGNKSYCVICDDNALLQTNPTISLFHQTDRWQYVFGNVIITGPEDDNGDLTSITKADANNIVSKITPIIIQGASNNDIAISPVIILD